MNILNTLLAVLFKQNGAVLVYTKRRIQDGRRLALKTHWWDSLIRLPSRVRLYELLLWTWMVWGGCWDVHVGFGGIAVQMRRPGGTLSMPAVIVWDRQRGPGGSAWQWWSWMKTSHCACALVPVSLRLQRSYECWSGVNAFRGKWWVKSVLRANFERMLRREKTPWATLLTAQCSTHMYTWKNIVHVYSASYCCSCSNPTRFTFDIPSLVVSCRVFPLRGGEIYCVAQ